jgi:hypothetical protein
MIQELLGVLIRGHLALPTNLTPTMFDATTVALSWTNNAAGAKTEVWRDGVLITTRNAGVNSYNDTGLSAGVAYAYQLRHLNVTTNAYSPRTAVVFGYTALPNPVSLSATPSGQTANLAWTNTAAQQTRVYRNGGLVTTLGIGVASYADNSLADAAYAYTVRHYDGSSESGDSNTANCTIDAIPSDPTSLAGTPINGSQNDLTWTPVDTTATAEIYRGTSANPTALLGTAGANAGAYSDTTAVAGTTYHYRVRNVRGGFYSGYSGDITVNTLGAGPTAAPSGLGATTPNTDRVSLAWTNGDASASTER